MSRHIDAVLELTALWQLVSIVLASSQIIVGKQWPPPRWFLGSSGPPPLVDHVIADGDDVYADGDLVIAS